MLFCACTTPKKKSEFDTFSIQICFEVQKKHIIPVFHCVDVVSFYCELVVGSRKDTYPNNKNLKYYQRLFSDISVDIIVTPCIRFHIVPVNCSVYYESSFLELLLLNTLNFRIF